MWKSQLLIAAPATEPYRGPDLSLTKVYLNEMAINVVPKVVYLGCLYIWCYYVAVSDITILEICVIFFYLIGSFFCFLAADFV